MKKIFIITCICAGLLCGCSRRIYVPVERVRIDSVAQWKTRIDSVELRDSVTVIIRGDTVTRDRIRYLQRTRVRHDTVLRVLRDTVPVIVPAQADKSASGGAKRVRGYLSRGISALALFGAGGVAAAALLLYIRRKRV